MNQVTAVPYSQDGHVRAQRQLGDAIRSHQSKTTKVASHKNPIFSPTLRRKKKRPMVLFSSEHEKKDGSSR